MGEAPNTINHNGSHRRVVALRQEIERKRYQIELEIDELKRRRTNAACLAQQGAKVAAGVFLGAVVIGSLTRAVRDLFRTDEEAKEEQQKAEVQRKSIASALAATLTSMAIAEGRKYAMEYARKRIIEGRRTSVA